MSDSIGQTIGRFRIDGLIKAGSSGTLYKAVEISSHEPVALRVLHAQVVSNSTIRQRVLSHARLISTLQHPNIARIEGYGESDGRVYIATELAPDGPLVSSPLTAPARPIHAHSLWHRLDLVRQAVDGLHYAHQKRIFHGDLNPKTLLLKQTATDVFLPKIVDFGFAAILDQSPEGTSDLPGSPAYLAPEQWQASETDGRTDIYAIGVILYQIAVGVLPFAASAPASAMYSHLYVAPQRPCQIRPDLPQELEATILHCLAKKAQDRFVSAADLSTAIRAVIRQKEEMPEPEVFPERASVLSDGALALRPQSLPVGRKEVISPGPVVLPTLRSKPMKGVPCFTVLDQRGAVLRRGYVHSEGATLGTAADNLVVLEAADISPHHARIDWDGHRVTITDLGSKNSTFLDEHRLLPQVPQVWSGSQQVRIGPYLLAIEQSSPDVEAKDVIDVIVERACKAMTLVPGKASDCRITLANHRTTVDHISVSVEGLPSEWVQGTGTEIALNPYDKHEVVLSIHVPKASSSIAGDYPVTIRANSVANPDQPGEAKVRWTVAPFDGFSLGVMPAKVTSRNRGKFSVSLHNQGNRKAVYTLSATQDEHELSFLFRTEGQNQDTHPKLELGPGARASVRLSAEPTKKHWVGKLRQHPFRIQSTPQEQGESQVHEVVLQQAPFVPTWVLVALPIVLAGILLIVPKFAKPKFKTVLIEPPNAIAGQPVTVHWEAWRAKRIEIRPVAGGIRAAQGSYGIPEGFQQTTVLTVVASNFFGADQREVVVGIRPQTPIPAAEMELSVSSEHINRGEGVTISWNVSRATRVQFSDVGDVNDRGEYTDNPQQDHTYTLTAYNSANAPTVKSVMVHVREVVPTAPPKPHLRVDKTLIKEGQSVLFSWDAEGAESVRIDSPTPTTLIGSSGERQAALKGKGTYTFTAVSTAHGLESKSDPVTVNVECTMIQQFTKRCHGGLLVEWH